MTTFINRDGSPTNEIQLSHPCDPSEWSKEQIWRMLTTTSIIDKLLPAWPLPPRRQIPRCAVCGRFGSRMSLWICEDTNTFSLVNDTLCRGCLKWLDSETAVTDNLELKPLPNPP